MLHTRAIGTEWIDRPGADADLAARSHAFMDSVNRFLGGARMVQRFVAEEAARKPGRLRVLDVGSGSSAVALAASRWARRRGLDVVFTCVDSNPDAIAIARRNIERASDPAVEAVQADILSYAPDRPFHCAVATMVFHHFDNEGVLALLCRLRRYVAGSVLINDLSRTWTCYLGCCLLTLFSPNKVRHDARLSVRRGFRPAELRSLLGRLDDVSLVSVRAAWAGRVRAVVRFLQGTAR